MVPWVHQSPQPKRHLDRFSRFWTDDCRVSLKFTMGFPFPPKNCPFPWGGSGPPSNTLFPGRTKVLNPNSILIGSAVFAGLTTVTDRQTDRPHYLVGNNRPIGHIYIRVLQCGLIIPVTTFLVHSSWWSHCQSLPSSFNECKLSARQAKQLGLWVCQ